MGTVGREPQLTFNEKGDPLCYLAVSINETIKEQETTTWYQVILFGNQAEQARNKLTKGSNVYIEGRLRPQQIKDKQGEVHTVLEVAGNTFHCLDSF